MGNRIKSTVKIASSTFSGTIEHSPPHVRASPLPTVTRVCADGCNTKFKCPARQDCINLFVDPLSTRMRTSCPLMDPATFNVDGTTCPSNAWKEMDGVSCVQTSSMRPSVSCSFIFGGGLPFGEAESPCSTIKQRNKAGLHLWPGVILEVQLKHSPFSRHAAISAGVRRLLAMMQLSD